MVVCCLCATKTQVIAFVEQHFIGASLREKQNAKMRFEFPQQAKPLAEMFGFIEVSEKMVESYAHGPLFFSCCILHVRSTNVFYVTTFSSIHLFFRTSVQSNPTQPNATSLNRIHPSFWWSVHLLIHPFRPFNPTQLQSESHPNLIRSDPNFRRTTARRFSWASTL